MGKGKKITLIIMLVLALLMGAMSAYGAMCPAYNPERLLIDPSESGLILYAILVTNGLQWVFIVANIFTWIASVGTLVMLIALIAKWKFFYIGTVVTSAIGVVSGLTPYLIVALNGGSTPSYMRAAIWGIILILMLIPAFKRSFDKNGISTTELGNKSNTTAALLFFPGALIGLQALFVGPSHMVLAAAQIYTYYGMVEAIQVGFGLLLMAVGVLVFAIAKIRSKRN